MFKMSPSSRHSIVNTLCGTSGTCSGNHGQSSGPSKTLILPVKPLETQEQPFCSSAMHMHRPWALIHFQLWISTRSPSDEYHTQLFQTPQWFFQLFQSTSK